MPAPLRVVACVDSTDAHSDVVFEAAAHLLATVPAAHLTVFSAARAGAPPPEAARQPRAIALHFEAKCVARFAKKRFEIMTAELPDDMPVRAGITAVVSELGADLVALGFTGRKGPKLDVTIAGTATDLTLREGRTPALIVKRGGPYDVVAVAVDGTARSLGALRLAALLAADAAAIVAVLVEEAGVAAEEAGDTVRVAVEAEFAAARAGAGGGGAAAAAVGEVGAAAAAPAAAAPAAAAPSAAPARRFEYVVRHAGEGVAAAFLRAADAAGAALVVAAPRDPAKSFPDDAAASADVRASRLGSFTDALVRSARIDVLVAHPAECAGHPHASARRG